MGITEAKIFFWFVYWVGLAFLVVILIALFFKLDAYQKKSAVKVGLPMIGLLVVGLIVPSAAPKMVRGLTVYSKWGGKVFGISSDNFLLLNVVCLILVTMNVVYIVNKYMNKKYSEFSINKLLK
ncbi:hypothetical protein [Heyndrickxia ginsengihumi]|uniref:hypothetical protein n=1 Tax=Heyndrickxia ginsengihumi TaxID=363870 RepID=UPI000470E490|nr:hypothetical protein [Heyndrickxia ginsengihumi]